MDQPQGTPDAADHDPAPEGGLDPILLRAQRMDGLGRLAGGLAHDLANPMAAIMAFGQLLQRDPRLPAATGHDAALLGREAAKAHRLIQTVLEYVRHRPPDPQPQHLRPIIDAVLDLQAFALVSGAVEVHVEVPADLPPVPAVRAQVLQALLNLTANAIEALSANGGGRLVVRAGLVQSGTAVRVQVADNGPGVAAADQHRIFEPGFTTKPDGRDGMGLPVARSIVAAHLGRIGFEPGPQGGAVFTIELPAGSGHGAGSGAEAQVRAGPADDAPAQGVGRLVLVVDDQPALRRMLGKALETPGLTVLAVADAKEALAVIRGGAPIAAVLCDLRMPGMSGFELFEIVAIEQPALAARFALMSGDVVDAALRRFAGERGIQLLAKPFDLAQIRTTVRRLADMA